MDVLLVSAAIWLLVVLPVGYLLGRGLRRLDEPSIQTRPDVPTFAFRRNSVTAGIDGGDPPR